MVKNFDPKNPLNSYTPSQGSLLEFIAPYIYALSQVTAERDNGDVDHYAHTYISSFITKAQIQVGLLDTDGFFDVISQPFDNWVKQKIKRGCDFISQSIYEMFTELPEEIKIALQQNLEGCAVRYEEVSLNSPKGQKLWITWESFPWFKANGDIAGIIFFCQDITKQKELYFDVCKLYSRAELLEKFSLIFSHDLIQPLRQISTYVSFLETELEDTMKNNPKISQNINSLNRCITKTKEICEGIVVYCKNGDLTINREPVNLEETMIMIIEWCRERPDIIINDFTSKNLILDVNKACVLQLFQNLLDNAIKHSINMPIEITISGQFIENNYYEFSLHNNGWCGDTLQQKNVFNAFYSNYADGAGLGLMICKKIIDAYGGNISFVSHPEEGTKITFSLPLYTEEDEETTYQRHVS